MNSDCVLCRVLQMETPIYDTQDYLAKIYSTKNLKHHLKRIMVVSCQHSKITDGLDFRMKELLKEAGLQIFDYTPKFVIMSTKFASVPNHPHYVASDLDPNSDDFEQILSTPWVEVVETNLASVAKVSPKRSLV